MSNPTYGPGHGAPGHEPEDDWFRPAPQAREEIYRESEYGNSAPPQFEPYQDAPYDGGYGHNGNSVHSNGYDAYSDGGQPYDAPYAAPNGPAPVNGTDPYSSMGRAGVNGSTGYDDGYGYGDPGETRLDGPPIRDMNPPGGGSGDGDDGDGGKPGKDGWKKYLPNWKIVAGVCALGLVASLTLVGVGYSTTPAPALSASSAQEGVLDQGSHVFWANPKKNTKPIYRIGQPRENVELEKIPLHVRQAVMAAEQKTFETDPGISPRGLMRAVYNTATGGQVQGGSTITQQLARNYLSSLSKDRSIGRKFKEIFTALKMEDKYSKDVILEKYLNTIHFGRQSDGIQAAARSYFHQNVDTLSVEQGALLAAVIQQPYNFCTNCPKDDPGYTGFVFRWNYVLNNMVEMGWLDKAKRDKMQFPKTEKIFLWTSEGGQVPYIRDRIDAELQSIPGLDYESVTTAGYRIYTSLNPALMRYAKQAVAEAGPQVKNPKIRSGLVVVDPDSGEIVAFYGGNPKRKQSDAALVEKPQLGSSFKPYVLATALSENVNVQSLIEGRGLICLNTSNGDVIPVKGETACKAKNGYWMRSTHSEGEAITLVKATEQSINSSFIRLGLKLGMKKVSDMAVAFGLPKKEMVHTDASLALGTVNVSALYQASGYAAFANGGTAVTPHMITKITKMENGKEVKAVSLPWEKPGKRLLTEDQAAQATEAMRAVVRSGTGTKAQLGSRPVAGKTGTTDGAAATWFVGYTPEFSAAATVFHQDSEKLDGQLGSETYGGEYPARIWQAFMTKALEGKEITQFPVPTYSGELVKYDTRKPKPTKTEEECNPLMQLAGQCGDGNNHGNPNPQDLPGCSQGQLPPAVACDPNKPPPGEENNPPDWWCPWHRDYPACQGNGNGNGNPNQPVDADGDGIPADQDPNDNDPNYPNQQHP